LQQDEKCQIYFFQVTKRLVFDGKSAEHEFYWPNDRNSCSADLPSKTNLLVIWKKIFDTFHPVAIFEGRSRVGCTTNRLGGT